MIGRDCKAQVAKVSEEMLQFESTADEQAFSSAIEEERLLHLLYYDFQKGQKLDGLRQFRQRCGEAMMMLITDESVSPLEYLRPGVTPDSLLLRPVSEAKLDATNGEFMKSFFERFQEKDAGSSFVVDTREEKVFIPYSQIWYFEARDKKLFVRTRHEEYAFYDTIEGLESRLPDMFRRCHRSYIVNTKKIRRVLPAENFIELEDQVGVPVSRSYKSTFREIWT